MKRYTPVLFFLSVSLSITSYFLMENGGKECYPFASWKLFTVPTGGADLEERYLLKAVSGKDTTIIRYHKLPNYDPSDAAVLVDFFAKKIVENQQAAHYKKKLHTFAKEVAPDALHYILVKEYFSPKALANHKEKAVQQTIAILK